MISDNCPRLRISAFPGHESEYEAFGLTYLAQYNTQALSQRSSDSYIRAFGITSIQMVPRVNGGRPGYLIARYDGAGVNKVVVAIEGTTSLTQLWTTAAGSLNAVIISGMPGAVWGIAANYAETIRVELLANNFFMHAFTRPNTACVFSGFSLGAAIADVLANRFKWSRPEQWVECWKFGSPRVGDGTWVSHNRRLDYRFSMCLVGDCAQLFPADNAYRNGEPGLFGRWGGIQMYCQDGVLRYRNPDGSYAASSGVSSGMLQNSRLVTSYFRARTIDNPWYYHGENQYRACYCELARNFGGMHAYRQLYLEHNDENSWQVDTRLNSGVPSNLRLIDPPPPAVQPGGDVARQIREANTQLLIEQNQFSESDTAGSSEGGDWGVAVVNDIALGEGTPPPLAPTPPSITWQRPRRTMR